MAEIKNEKNTENNSKQLKKRYEIAACAFLFGVAMIIIGVFL